MPGFKRFLTEKETPIGHRQELSEGDFVDALKKRARNSYTVIKQSPLFIHAEGADYVLMTPSEKPSRSPFWLDRIVSDSHLWKRYPDRQRCLRAYTDINRVGDGSIYVVIPLDGTRVGVCSAMSFYRSFKHAEKALDLKKLDNEGLENWSKLVVIGLNKLGADLTEGDLDSIGDFKKRLRVIDKFLQSTTRSKLNNVFKEKRDEMEDTTRKVMGDILSRHVTNIDAYLEEKLDPEGNGFQLMKIESMHRFTEDREIWISGPCLLIKRDKYLDMHKRGVVT